MVKRCPLVTRRSLAAGCKRVRPEQRDVVHHREGVLLEPVMSHTDLGARCCIDPWTGCDERRVDDPAAVQDDVPDVPELKDGTTYRGGDCPAETGQREDVLELGRAGRAPLLRLPFAIDSPHQSVKVASERAVSLHLETLMSWRKVLGP